MAKRILGKTDLSLSSLLAGEDFEGQDLRRSAAELQEGLPGGGQGLEKWARSEK